MGVLEAIAELIAPTRCAGCDLPGALLCDACRRVLESYDADTSCPSCAAPFGRLVCTECWEQSFAFEAAIALGVLDSPLSRSVVLHKDAGERRLGGLLGGLLGEAVRQQWPGWADVVTWVPPTDAALIRRGFDHCRSIAAAVGERGYTPAQPLLVRGKAQDQRRLGRQQRARNVAQTFSARSESGGNVLVVDDVLTTGATLEAAAQCLLEAGAQAVRVAVVARAW